MRRYLAIVFTAVALLSSCEKPGTSFSDKYVESVDVDTQNALRACVDVSFKSECRWSVSYWEKKLGPSSAKTTPVMSSSTTRVCLLDLSPVTKYEYKVNIENSTATETCEFETESFPEDFPVYPVVRTQLDVWKDGYVFQCEDEAPGYLTLCDFSAKVHWYDSYGKGIVNFDYDPKTGLIALLLGKKDAESPLSRLCEEIRVVDLAGKTVFSSPATGIFDGAHHWISFTEDGNLMFMCVEKENGGWADGFKVVDLKGNEIFKWSEFSSDYMRATSVGDDGQGNFYVTLAATTQVCKVDGKSGDVVYRYGAGGDIAMPEDLFFHSGAHSIIVYGPDKFSFYANGDPAKMDARGVFVTVDPSSRTGQYDLIAVQPAPQYSPDLGSVMVVDDETLLFCGTYPNPIPAFGMSRNLQFLSTSGAMVRNMTRSGISARAQYITDDQIVF